MTGAELAEYARFQYPEMNIIVMSGTNLGSLPSNTTLLHKRFLPARVLDAVRA
jgi:hypothetical protein